MISFYKLTILKLTKLTVHSYNRSPSKQNVNPQTLRYVTILRFHFILNDE